MSVVNLADKFSRFSDHWHPRIVGELNGQQVKVAKLLGAFDWHHHANEDELFLVVKGTLLMRLRDGDHKAPTAPSQPARSTTRRDPQTSRSGAPRTDARRVARGRQPAPDV